MVIQTDKLHHLHKIECVFFLVDRSMVIWEPRYNSGQDWQDTGNLSQRYSKFFVIIMINLSTG